MLSQRQAATMDFLNASQYLRQVADDHHGIGMLEFTDSFIQSILSFGNSELYARQAGRSKGLKIQESLVKESMQMSKEYNEKGFRNLSYARDTLKQLRKELESYPEVKLDKKDVASFQSELMHQVSELEIKESDALKIKEAFSSSLESIISGGAKALPDYLEQQIDKLEKIRRQPDRGAVDNIPVWKVAAIVVAVGVWVWALFRCKWWGSCSLREGLAYFIVFWIAALIAKFC